MTAKKEMTLPKSIQNLIEEFAKLPTIGRKSAERFVLYLLKKNQTDLDKFATAIINLKKGIKKCEICGCLTEQSPCEICRDLKREKNQVCVVATARDLIIIENANFYNGVYHVLGGYIDAIKNITVKNLNISSLFKRLKDDDIIKEVILALSPTFEGEATAMYISEEIKKNYKNIKITRLARGLPTGSDLQYADELTIKNALKYRN